MDLSAIINNEGGDDKAAAAVAQPPATPSSSSQHPQSRHASSANANKLYTEYSNSSVDRQRQHDVSRQSASYEYDQGRQQSRTTSASGDYRQQSRTPHEQFASPIAAYQRPQLHSQTAPLANSNNELLSRSPRSAASYPSQSPLFPRNSSGPFSYQSTNSPGQERISIPHQNSTGSLQRQESYPQPSVSQYLQSPVPVTPPSALAPPGGYPPYLQQQQHSRSLSAHSNSTPTSAHSQYNQSPLLMQAYPTSAHSQQRSQPGTPLGPPISTHRSGTYPQHQQYPTDARLSTSPQQSRGSLPPPPPPAALHQSQQDYERRISVEAEQIRSYGYDGQANPRSQSQSQQILQAHVPESYPPQQQQYERRRPREQSLSVSPKTTPATRAPPQEYQRQEPTYVPQPQAQHQLQAPVQAPPPPQLQQEQHMSRDQVDYRNQTGSGQKRKMDRHSSERSDGRGSEPPMQRRRIEETSDTEGETTTDERSPEQQRMRPVKRETHFQTPQPQTQQNKRPQSEDSQREARPRKRKRYAQETMPIWARSWPEFIKFKKMYPDGKFFGVPVASIGGAIIPDRPSAPPQTNGAPSRQASQSPPAQTNGRGQSAAPPGAPGDEMSAILGLPFANNVTPIVPPNPITKQIADFLYVTVIDRNDWNQLLSHKIQIEVEAKLGTLIDKGTNQRLELPIASEAVLTHGMVSKVAFRSEMVEGVFRKGNTWLNNATEKALRTEAPVEYKHRREVDSFHQLPSSKLNELPPAMQSILNTPATRNRGLKVRVSHDQKTGKEIARIVKARVADLDVYFPTSQLDCRISVNLEMEYDGDLPIDAGIKNAPGNDEGDRRKDRLSYKQSGYTIDLTQVSSGNAPPTHELEIEIDTDILVEQGRRLGAGEKSGYVELVEGLVNRMRSLVGELGE